MGSEDVLDKEPGNRKLRIFLLMLCTTP